MRFFREPLLHFLAAGAVLFGAYAWINRGQDAAPAVEPVTVTEGDVKWLVETWSRQWLREPGPDEVKGMIADLVDEELMAREAVEMGLEKDDTIVRRRLAQKLKFLVEDTSRLVEPTEEELRGYHAANADRFRAGATVSFEQVFFNPTNRPDAEADAAVSLVALRGEERGALAPTAGDRFLIDSDFRNLDRTAVAGLFGPDFAETVFALEPGVWSGPIKSGYGLHLVFVSEASPAKPRTFEEVRDAVVADWWRVKEEAASRDYIGQLRAKYGVVLDDSVKEILGEDAPADETAATR